MNERNEESKRESKERSERSINRSFLHKLGEGRGREGEKLFKKVSSGFKCDSSSQSRHETGRRRPRGAATVKFTFARDWIDVSFLLFSF